MTKTMKRCVRTAAALIVLALSAVAVTGQVARAGSLQDRPAVNPVYYGVRGRSSGPESDKAKILAVLKSRVRGGNVIEKAGEKLEGMSEKDVRLIASLCERVPAGERTAASDIAFLLATALVVLS